jgi:hypothetical protein
MARPAEIIKPPPPDWAALNLKPGNRLGKYHLKQCLGTGGSCEVWKARDTVEGIWVALKIPQAGTASPALRYNARCKYCDGKLLRFMRYCPWCHRKLRQNWQVRPFPELCSSCAWPVDSEFWNYCPWCKQNLTT